MKKKQKKGRRRKKMASRRGQLEEHCHQFMVVIVCKSNHLGNAGKEIQVSQSIIRQTTPAIVTSILGVDSVTTACECLLYDPSNNTDLSCA
jgi:hypothetical protein